MLFSEIALLVTLLHLPRRRNRRFRQYVFNRQTHAKTFIQKKKYELALACVRTFSCYGGGEGIRTPVGLRPNGFQDRLVMTASIRLRIEMLCRVDRTTALL